MPPKHSLPAHTRTSADSPEKPIFTVIRDYSTLDTSTESPGVMSKETLQQEVKDAVEARRVTRVELSRARTGDLNAPFVSGTLEDRKKDEQSPAFQAANAAEFLASVSFTLERKVVELSQHPETALAQGDVQGGVSLPARAAARIAMAHETDPSNALLASFLENDVTFTLDSLVSSESVAQTVPWPLPELGSMVLTAIHGVPHEA
jgi:hypothetical protein